LKALKGKTAFRFDRMLFFEVNLKLQKLLIAVGLRTFARGCL
jgi:hypothetical protein